MLCLWQAYTSNSIIVIVILKYFHYFSVNVITLFHCFKAMQIIVLLVYILIILDSTIKVGIELIQWNIDCVSEHKFLIQTVKHYFTQYFVAFSEEMKKYWVNLVLLPSYWRWSIMLIFHYFCTELPRRGYNSVLSVVQMTPDLASVICSLRYSLQRDLFAAFN